MGKCRKLIRTHKKLSIGILIALILIVIAVVVAVATHGRGSTGKEKDKQTAGYEDWEDKIADLEDEPASEHDVVFEDPKSLKGTPYQIMINKTQNCVTIYKKGSDGEYSDPVRSMICSVGYDTPVGTFQTSDKYTWKIVNGNVWAQYATRVTGNVLIHSMPYQSYDKGTLLAGYYNQLGSTMSASCIRMSAKDADWIMENCPAGTTVTVYESLDEEKLKRPHAIKVDDDCVWDPTDPDGANPWNAVVLSYQNLDDERNIERGLQFDYLDGIEINDTCGNDITEDVVVTGIMDVFTPGDYQMNYHVEDASGKTADKTVTFHVQDTAVPAFCGLKDTLYFTSTAAVTRESILKGVTLLDNNTVLSKDSVQMELPEIIEGTNIISMALDDGFGNVATAVVTVIVDSNPPTVALNATAAKILPLTQTVDRAYALTRITAMDDGVPVDEGQITVSITPVLWGYNLLYKVKDLQGNISSFQDSVTYVEYSLEVHGDVTVSDLNDQKQLTNNITVKGSNGTTVTDAVIDVRTTLVSGSQYTATYTYTYTSPIGTKTATATGPVILKAAPAASQTPEPKPTVSPQVSEPANATQTPQVPSTSPEPQGSESPEEE